MTAPPRRLYEPAAYDFGAPVGSYWETTVQAPTWPTVTGDMQADVVVIGAGYTGLSTALHLARDHGVKALVLDAGKPGWGASGRNGGFCCLGGTGASAATLTRRFGPKAQDDVTRSEAEAVYLVAELLDRHAISADVQPGGEICLAHSPRTARSMQQQAAHLSRVLRVDVDYLPRTRLRAEGLGAAGSFGAMHLPVGFGLNPLKYALGLARAAAGAGADLRQEAEVSAITPAPQGYSLTVGPHTVRAGQIVLATNGYSADTVPNWMAGRYMPVLSNIMVTRPLTDAELAAQSWQSQVPSYDSRNLLHYVRLLPDNRMLFGLRGNTAVTPRSEARIRRRIRRDFAAMFPAWSGVEASHIWNGLACMSTDLTPYIGPINAARADAWAGFAWHGNGVAAGTHAGQMLARLVAGEAQTDVVPRVAQDPPPRLPLARYRRALLPLAVAWKGLCDALS